MSTATATGRRGTYRALADLPLVVEAYSLEGLQRPWSPQFTRRTTVVQLRGGGAVGEGEDVTYTPADHELFQAAGPTLPVTGHHTLASFSERLDALDLFALPPARRDSVAHRRWAFESAALDLALRQNGLSLATALGRLAEAVSFVVSMRLPSPVTAEPVLRRLELYPDMRFKLDVDDSWTDELIAELAATGAIHAVDFKAYYEDLPVDTRVDPSLYERVVEGLPDAWLEDPAITTETAAVLETNADRITWDAPIRSVADLVDLPVRPAHVNVKPSRFGTLAGLLDAYDHLAEVGIGAYGGGQFELGPGRGHIQYLASLFHADAANDVAPLGHHEIRAGLPASPLAPRPSAIGFGWTS